MGTAFLFGDSRKRARLGSEESGDAQRLLHALAARSRPSVNGDESESDEGGDEGGGEGGGADERRVIARLVGPQLLHRVGQQLGLPKLWHLTPAEALGAWEQLQRTGGLDGLSRGQREALFVHIVDARRPLPPMWAWAVAQAVPPPAPGAAPGPPRATPDAEEGLLLPHGAGTSVLALFLPPPPPPRPATIIQMALALNPGLGPFALPPADPSDPLELSTLFGAALTLSGPTTAVRGRVRVRG